MNRLRPILAIALVASLLTPAMPAAAVGRGRVRVLPADPLAIPTPAQADSIGTPAEDSVIVRMKGAVTADKLSEVYRATDSSAGAVTPMRGDLLTWEVPPGESTTQFAEDLERTGKIEYAEPNYVRQLAAYTPPAYEEPDDPAYRHTGTLTVTYGGVVAERYAHAESWWLRSIAAVSPAGPNAWKTGYTGADTTGKYPLRADGSAFKVAVLDSGLYLDHPDRSANMVAGSADVTPPNPSAIVGAKSYSDAVAQTSHGTCVSGEIAATANNGIGSLGLANDTTVASYKVYSGAGISDDVLISAIHKAADDGCKVINLSIAGGPASDALQSAIDYAWHKGCVIVAASGNEGNSQVSNPAAMNHVVAVGALALNSSGNRKRAYYSNYGSALDLSAPGSSIWGMTKPGYTDPLDDLAEPGYRWWDGTSMASPVVAGAIAWLWRAAPWMTNSQIVALVRSTADDLGTSGRDDAYGYGALNMDAAYAKLIEDYPLLGAPAITVVSEDNARNVRIEWAGVVGDAVTYDVEVDGKTVVSDTAVRTYTLPYDTTPGSHTVTVSAKSPHNWTDVNSSDSVSVYPSVSIPEVTSLAHTHGQLRWSGTEADRAHTDLLSIDGGPPQAVSGGATSTASLPLGSHIASLTVLDGDGSRSEPATLAFTVRPTPTVSRVTGSDRYGYAAAISRSAFATATVAVLVGDDSWVDAFSAAPLAHLLGGPVLVSARNSLPASTKTELARLGVTRIVIVGDSSDVSTSLRRSLARRYAVTRVSGSDRYATANAVAREIAKLSGGVLADGRAVVVGDSFTAALAGSSVAAREGWPLLYTKKSAVPSATRSTLAAIGASSTLVVGSASSVSAAAAEQLPHATRAPGSGLGIATGLATWALTTRPASFSGERVYLANSTRWAAVLGLPAASAEVGGLTLVTTPSLASAVEEYYEANDEVAVTTRVTATSAGVSPAAVSRIKSIVGAE